MAAQTLTDSQQAALAAEFDDKKGNPATIDTVPVWASNDETVATVAAAMPDGTPDPTGMNAIVTAVGKIGTAQISVTDTPSDGSAPIVGTLDITVTAGAAVSANVKVGAVTEQP